MKRILFAAVIAMALGMLASESKANGWGAPPAPSPFGGQQAAGPVGPVGDRYGYNPMLRHMMWWKKDRCGNGCGAQAGPGGPGGTMVFPVNPYIRSPRDWFQN